MRCYKQSYTLCCDSLCRKYLYNFALNGRCRRQDTHCCAHQCGLRVCCVHDKEQGSLWWRHQSPPGSSSTPPTWPSASSSPGCLCHHQHYLYRGISIFTRTPSKRFLVGYASLAHCCTRFPCYLGMEINAGTQ